MDVHLQYTEGDPDATAKAEALVTAQEVQATKFLSRSTPFGRGSPVRVQRTHTEEAGALISLTVLEGLDIVNPDAVTHVSG